MMANATDPPGVRWHVADIADAVEAGLARRIDLDREAQAVHGIDVLDEVSLHPMLADAMETAGFGVHREVRYPAARPRRSRAEGRRCDLVLTPDGRPLQDPAAAATLFDDPEAVPLEEAFWLEVKVVAQFSERGANPSWSNELLGTVRKDIAKLRGDARIFHAGLLIVLWVERAEVAAHDFEVWQRHCLDQGLPISAPTERQFSLQDRVGNRHGVARIYPVHHA
ncbi:MAG: hypothetical protein QF733_01905 [Phycisphaerales bacterium]|jgi:hypothetical protein|nr:hypothetical protein [Phycisphaerales bacterium]